MWEAPIIVRPLARWSPGSERLETRTRKEITGLVIHRIEVSQEDPSFHDSPEEIARFFREHPIGVEATGGAMPYPLLIAPDGAVTQTLPLLQIAPHAAAHNPMTIGVGLVGDFRRVPPSAAQRRSLVQVCATLLVQLRLDCAAVYGHDELQHGSRDPDKECPGRMLPMAELRREIGALPAGETPDLVFHWTG